MNSIVVINVVDFKRFKCLRGTRVLWSFRHHQWVFLLTFDVYVIDTQCKLNHGVQYTEVLRITWKVSGISSVRQYYV